MERRKRSLEVAAPLPPAAGLTAAHMLADLDIEVESHCRAIQKEADDLCDRLESDFKRRLAAISHSVRNMPLKRLIETFGGNFSDALREKPLSEETSFNTWVAATPRVKDVAKARRNVRGDDTTEDIIKMTPASKRVLRSASKAMRDRAVAAAPAPPVVESASVSVSMDDSVSGPAPARATRRSTRNSSSSSASSTSATTAFQQVFTAPDAPSGRVSTHAHASAATAPAPAVAPSTTFFQTPVRPQPKRPRTTAAAARAPVVVAPGGAGGVLRTATGARQASVAVAANTRVGSLRSRAGTATAAAGTARKMSTAAGAIAGAAAEGENTMPGATAAADVFAKVREADAAVAPIVRTTTRRAAVAAGLRR